MIGYTCLRLRSPPGPEKLLKARRGMWPDEAGQTPWNQKVAHTLTLPFLGKGLSPKRLLRAPRKARTYCFQSGWFVYI